MFHTETSAYRFVSKIARYPITYKLVPKKGRLSTNRYDLSTADMTAIVSRTIPNSCPNKARIVVQTIAAITVFSEML